MQVSLLLIDGVGLLYTLPHKATPLKSLRWLSTSLTSTSLSIGTDFRGSKYPSKKQFWSHSITYYCSPWIFRSFDSMSWVAILSSCSTIKSSRSCWTKEKLWTLKTSKGALLCIGHPLVDMYLSLGYSSFQNYLLKSVFYRFCFSMVLPKQEPMMMETLPLMLFVQRATWKNRAKTTTLPRFKNCWKCRGTQREYQPHYHPLILLKPVLCCWGRCSCSDSNLFPRWSNSRPFTRSVFVQWIASSHRVRM